MNRKYLMILSSFVMGFLGFLLIFLPNETLQFFSQESSEISALILQLMGALYFGFAVLNWMAKNVLIGGIYAKPLSLGNFASFFIGGLTLIKVMMNGNSTDVYIWILTVLYVVFAIAFGFVSFTSPKLSVKD